MRGLVAVCLASLAWLLPAAASAHLVSPRFGALYSGLLHPLITLAHLLPWLGLGLLGGLQAPAIARVGPLALPIAAAAGALLGSLTPAPAWVPYVNLGSFLAVGLLVALALRLAAPAFAALTIAVGLTHGYANGAPELSGRALLLYASGVGVAAYLLITLVSGAARSAQTRAAWGTIALRAAGSWIVAAGLVFGGFLLMGRA